jgi:hypothetical protein
LIRFPHAEQLSLPCQFEAVLPGRLHPDGRRYLPLLLLRPTATASSAAAQVTPPGFRLAVVDRHHVVDQRQVGQNGSARLVCALSAVRLQTGSSRQGLLPEAASGAEQASSAPTLFGQVQEVMTWEVGAHQLTYESVYMELLLDVGLGTVGLRTSVTAASLAERIGTARIQPGDWLELSRSRIDILGLTQPQVH